MNESLWRCLVGSSEKYRQICCLNMDLAGWDSTGSCECLYAPKLKLNRDGETLLPTFQILPLLQSIKMLQNPRVKTQVGRIPGVGEPKGPHTHWRGSSRENTGSCGHAWNIRREQFQHRIQSPWGRWDCGDTVFLIFNPAPVEHGTQENPKLEYKRQEKKNRELV